VGGDTPPVRPSAQPLPGRAAGDRALVRPAATRAALGWQPSVNLDKGFRRLGDWYRRPPRPAMRI